MGCKKTPFPFLSTFATNFYKDGGNHASIKPIYHSLLFAIVNCLQFCSGAKLQTVHLKTNPFLFLSSFAKNEKLGNYLAFTIPIDPFLLSQFAKNFCKIGKIQLDLYITHWPFPISFIILLENFYRPRGNPCFNTHIAIHYCTNCLLWWIACKMAPPPPSPNDTSLSTVSWWSSILALMNIRDSNSWSATPSSSDKRQFK